MYCVKELGGAGGLHRKPGKAGNKGGEGCDIPGCPARAQHISTAEIQDEHKSGHGDNPVHGRQGSVPDVGPDGGALVSGEICLVSLGAFPFAAEDPVGYGVGGPVKGGGA